MKTAQDLKNQLQSIHRKSYPAYKELRGKYSFDDYILSIDHVQGDPFASPSHISAEIPLKTAGFPSSCHNASCTRIALQDYLNRQFEQQVNHYSFRAKGSGKSGLISVSHCGQEILERTACQISQTSVIARFTVGFPANGRTINAPELEKIFFLPKSQQKTNRRNGFSCRRSGIYPKRTEETSAHRFCCRWVHPPATKRCFPKAPKRQYSFCIPGFPCCRIAFTSQRKTAGNGHSGRHYPHCWRGLPRKVHTASCTGNRCI